MSLGHVILEKSIKHLDRDVEEAVRYIRMGLGREVFAKDTNSEVISIQTVLKYQGIHQRVGREEKRNNNGAPKHYSIMRPEKRGD